ncbi:hypothetical protein DUZ99_13530 [Xylanibacillus composti]|uniref:AtpZ/AtpI family protein n=1 Tax=Xylanibacillus composti TaxID=1572762 RepID=A0A8J4H8U1_9BACL|nr:AtpZ/AtpI family protein [Xylanibacillus composti]MDT9725997.1 hypothetical protein [Xylanibacillus composti]GIQ70848.1 hypothetical protein XYCOK13_36720 [Xylanibacillus composti]
MKGQKSQDNPWKTLGWTSLIGLEVAVCITAGYFGGAFLGSRTGEPAWKIVGVLVGLAVGILSIVLLIKRYLEEANE